MPEPFRKAAPGQPWQPSARLHNATIDAIRDVARLQRTGAGDPGTARKLWGVITDAGPLDDADPPVAAANYTDERYWVKISHIDGDDSVTTNPADLHTHITTSFSDDPARIITATNDAEMYLDKEEGGITTRQSGTHALPKGLHVRLEYYIDGRGNRRYVFTREPKYVVRVTGNAAGGGVYTGQLVGEASADFDPSATVSSTSFGALLTGEVYIINGAEEGQATHDLTSGTPISRQHNATRRSRKSDDDKHVFLINGHDAKTCTPPA